MTDSVDCGVSVSPRPQRGAYRYSQLISAIGVRSVDLCEGDHIYRLTNEETERDKNGEQQKLVYDYSHHGIVVAMNKQTSGGEVVNFTGSKKRKKQQNPQDGPPRKRKVRKMVAKHATGRVGQGVRNVAAKFGQIKRANSKEEMLIRRTPLTDFLHKDEITGEAKYLRYEYRCSNFKHKEGSPFAARDPGTAVKVANWFAENPQAFGKYDLLELNCEHFASFCKTTTLTPTELDGAPKQKKGRLSRHYLESKSEMRSWQTEPAWRSRKSVNIQSEESSNDLSLLSDTSFSLE